MRISFNFYETALVMISLCVIVCQLSQTQLSATWASSVGNLRRFHANFDFEFEVKFELEGSLQKKGKLKWEEKKGEQLLLGHFKAQGRARADQLPACADGALALPREGTQWLQLVPLFLLGSLDVVSGGHTHLRPMRHFSKMGMEWHAIRLKSWQSEQQK